MHTEREEKHCKRVGGDNSVTTLSRLNNGLTKQNQEIQTEVKATPSLFVLNRLNQNLFL